MILLLPLLLAASVATSAPPARATLTGQLVCSVCWSEADRATVPYGTEADRECFVRCAKGSVPPALAVRDAEGWRLVKIAREGALASSIWFEDVARMVEITGTLRDGTEPGERWIVPDSVRRVEVPPVPVLGKGPKLQAWDLDGTPRGLDVFAGKVVVLNFWATWCAPCRAEMPHFVELGKAMAAEPVAIVAWASNGRSESAQVKAFAKKYGMDFTVWVGANGADLEAFGLPPSLPSTVVLASDGSVVERIVGLATKEQLVAAVKKGLAK